MLFTSDFPVGIRQEPTTERMAPQKKRYWKEAGKLKTQVLLLVVVAVVYLTATEVARDQFASKQYKKNVAKYLFPNQTAETNGSVRLGRSETAVKDYANREVVVLASHGRSGSTVAESLFFRSVEGFVYFDEPLRPLSSAKKTIAEKVDALMAMLSDCEAYETMAKADIPPKELSDWFLLRISHEGLPSWVHLPKARKSARPKEILGAFESACRKSPIVGGKVIRMGTGMKDALDRYKNLRIIHLIRHPNEVFESQKELGWNSCFNPIPNLHNLCEVTEKDYGSIMGDADANRYEGRYLVVRYQDLVTDPLNVTLKVQNFMGVTLGGDALEKFVKEKFVTNFSDKLLQYGGKRHSHAYATVRKRRECGACGSAVEAVIDADLTCRHVVDKIGLQCCNETA